MNKFLEMRKNESRKLNELNYPYGNVTSINLTMLKGGIKLNIVPHEAKLFVDMRLAVDVNWDDLESLVRSIHILKNLKKTHFLLFLLSNIDHELGKRSWRKCYN